MAIYDERKERVTDLKECAKIHLPRPLEVKKEAHLEIRREVHSEVGEEEEEAMKLHPKMALPKKLESGFMDVALDMSYTKVRWQLRKEEEQRVKEDESIEDRKKRRISEEEIDRRGQIQAGI